VYDRSKSWSGIVNALNRIATLLDDTTGGTVTGGVVYATRRDDGAPPPRVEIEPDGREYRQAGRYYHLAIQST
jgi:hypothetical protein